MIKTCLERRKLLFIVFYIFFKTQISTYIKFSISYLTLREGYKVRKKNILKFPEPEAAVIHQSEVLREDSHPQRKKEEENFHSKRSSIHSPSQSQFIREREMSLNIFVYGTLKTGEPNHYWFEEASAKDGARVDLVGAGITLEKLPLIVSTEFNIPMLLGSL